MHGPWILPDELIYSELAKSVAHDGHFAIRGVATHRYALLYSLLISPAFLFRNLDVAYTIVKAVNALLLSAAAIPAYLLARRALSQGYALVVAFLTVSVPSMAYAGVVMTENLFYPVFLLVVLAMTRAVERPTLSRQLVALAALVVAVATRAQALALFPAYVCAIAVLGIARRDVRRTLRLYAPTLVLLATALAAVVAAEAARGKSPRAALGFYGSAIRGYPLLPVPKWILYHVAEFGIYLGVIPMIAAVAFLPALVGRRERAMPVALIAVGLSAGLWSLLIVATTSADWKKMPPNYPVLPPRLHERSLFYFAPLFFIALCAWLQSPQLRRSRASVVAAGLVVLAPLAVPFSRLLTNASFESLALTPWERVPGLRFVLAGFAAALASVAFLRRRSTALPIVVVFLAVWITGQVAAANMQNLSRPISDYSHQRHWIDERTHGAAVAILWRRGPRWNLETTLHREQAIWKDEFFNRSLGAAYSLARPMQYQLPQTPLRVIGRRLVAPGDEKRLASYRYALATSTFHVAGSVVARDRRAGLVLYRLSTPLRLASGIR